MAERIELAAIVAADVVRLNRPSGVGEGGGLAHIQALHGDLHSTDETILGFGRAPQDRSTELRVDIHPADAFEQSYSNVTGCGPLGRRAHSDGARRC
jgi:hypothetical protein